MLLPAESSGHRVLVVRGNLGPETADSLSEPATVSPVMAVEECVAAVSVQGAELLTAPKKATVGSGSCPCLCVCVCVRVSPFPFLWRWADGDAPTPTLAREEEVDEGDLAVGAKPAIDAAAAFVASSREVAVLALGELGLSCSSTRPISLVCWCWLGPELEAACGADCGFVTWWEWG